MKKVTLNYEVKFKKIKRKIIIDTLKNNRKFKEVKYLLKGKGHYTEVFNKYLSILESYKK